MREGSPDLQSLWDYDDPAATRSRFEAALPIAEQANNRQYHAELLTQIARTEGLEGRFDDAHATLDRADALVDKSMPRARVRSLLERGRTFNSARNPDQARPLFVEAWEVAREEAIDGLAVDAAHMVAIVESPASALEWNQRALELANRSSDRDAQRWRGSLCNNVGWTYHDQGNYKTALDHFEQALKHRLEQGKPKEMRTARWCVARCLRSLGRLDEALTIQLDLEREIQETGGDEDGYVPEEIAECLHALGRTSEARSYFKRAHELLSHDARLAEHEPDRLKRLSELSR